MSPHPIKQSIYIGVDLGGTNIVCGAVTDDGTLLHKITWPTEAYKGEDHVLVKIVSMIREVTAQASSMGVIFAIGIGCPGIVNPETGIVEAAANLGWGIVNVSRDLSRITKMDVFVNNDVRMYVYGEAIRGAGKNYRNVLGVTLGTGLACAFVQDGQLLYGNRFMAGELGHIRGEGISYECSCGKVGCYETVLSATGITRQAIEKLHNGQESILHARFNNTNLSNLTAADVSIGYDSNDALCIDVMNRTGHILGQALAVATRLYSPDIIVVGGGVAKAGERLLHSTRATLFAELFPIFNESVTLTTAISIDDAGVIGSALFASQQYK